MIKYRPVRRSLSASIKEEETFSTMEDLLHLLRERASHFAEYIGSEPPEITVRESAADDPLTGYRNERCIYSGSVCIGFCGE